MCAVRLIDVRRPAPASKTPRAVPAPAPDDTRAARRDVIIGDDWTAPGDGPARPNRRSAIISLKRSPLARKIITFNLLALIILVAGMLYLTPSRDSLAFQRAGGLVAETVLIVQVIEARLSGGAPVRLASDARALFDDLDLRGGIVVALYDTKGQLLAQTAAAKTADIPGLSQFDSGGTLITGALDRLWDYIARTLATDSTPSAPSAGNGDDAPGQDLVARAMAEGTLIQGVRAAGGASQFLVVSPIVQGNRPVGAIAVQSAPGELDALVNRERDRVLQMFVVGALVSIGLSLLLASTIANPIADLAAAAERGRDRDRDTRSLGTGRLPIPDLTARPDEIGRLSGALRSMVAALYDRIDSNKQFAADVAHEIKNPLASLRSAVGTIRMTKREDQREKLLDIIDHDVRRLDRLVTDIASASHLDSELVKEEEKSFDLLRMIANLNEFLAKEAAEKGIEYIADLPSGPVIIRGLEMRLAQVMVNLITNAISFCEDGDAVRIWVRQRDKRVLIVVEDTGPGIPESALTRVFERFYSERPAEHFGNNSGLGLSISKQIVEAHNGVIWAENIRPTDADPTSDPLGARFVVGLPL
jgi:two-component system sensor histidine kinase ChvG